MDSSVLEVVAARMTLNPGARALVATMRAGGAYCALVSGGFTCFTESIRAACGFDEARANCLEVADGRITGKVPDPVLGRAATLKALEAPAAAQGAVPFAARGVGHGTNDLDLLGDPGLRAPSSPPPTVPARPRS